jgi:hypothetical protein
MDLPPGRGWEKALGKIFEAARDHGETGYTSRILAAGAYSDLTALTVIPTFFHRIGTIAGRREALELWEVHPGGGVWQSAYSSTGRDLRAAFDRLNIALNTEQERLDIVTT